MSNRSACIFSQRRVGGEAETSGLRYRGGTLVRTERLLSVAAILAQATFVCCGSAAQSASPPAPSGSTAVELVKALAWPLATLLIGVVFHRQIALFMSALGSRITKLSLFKVELELVPATAATTTPLLDAIRGWKPLGRVSKSRFSLSPFSPMLRSCLWERSGFHIPVPFPLCIPKTSFGVQSTQCNIVTS